MTTEDAIPFSDWVSQHDTAIRNATLDELHSWGYYRYRNSLVKTNGINEYTAWSEHIESLRTKEQL